MHFGLGEHASKLKGEGGRIVPANAKAFMKTVADCFHFKSENKF